MNKEEVLIDFLRGLRIALNNASAYSKEHPYFIRSIKTFKQKVDMLLRFISPIKINITPDSLFIDGRYWEKDILYVELAQILHLRKIKSAEFRDGLTVEELIDLLSSVSLPVKQILRQGGIQNILNRSGSPHFFVEELDYSEFLRDEGEECKNIWVYMFGEVIDKQEVHKIHKFVDNFGEIIEKFEAKDLFIDEEFRENIYNFLGYLKDKEKDKFYKCTKQLLKFVLRDRNIIQKYNLDKIRIFFKDLNKEDLAETLWNEISNDDDLNYFSFITFSKLFGENTHKEIAPILESKIKNAESLKTNFKIREKIKELFSVSESSFISALYRHALYWLSESNFLEGSLSLDYELLRINYRFALLNLLAAEKGRKGLNLISQYLLKELDRIYAQKDLEYLKFIWGVLDKKIKDDASQVDLFKELRMSISEFIEKTAFEGETPAGLEYFIDTLKSSALGFDFYLDKIFNERKVTPYALTLLLKFFPEKIPYVYENLKKKHFDIELIGKIVKSLEKVDSLLSLEALKHIFYFSNNIIKIEVLRSMRLLSERDEDFLFSILKQAESFLKKEALVVFSENEKTRKKALEELFFIPNPWGKNNKVIIENIMLVEDINLKEAEEYLVAFSKRHFFWNSKVRKKAKEVLKNWNAGKD